MSSNVQTGNNSTDGIVKSDVNNLYHFTHIFLSVPIMTTLLFVTSYASYHNFINSNLPVRAVKLKCLFQRLLID